MAAASSKLHSPLWTPSTELSEAQQKSWPEAHYLSNAPSLTDCRGRAHVGAPYSLWLTRHKRTETVLPRAFQTHLDFQSISTLKMSSQRQLTSLLRHPDRTRQQHRIFSFISECESETVRCFPADTAMMDTNLTSIPAPQSLQSLGAPLRITTQFHWVYWGMFTCGASQKLWEHTPRMEIYKYKCTVYFYIYRFVYIQWTAVLFIEATRQHIQFDKSKAAVS